MKNIHVIPTEKPSRLFKFANQLHLDTIPKDYYKKYQIYITSDEEIKEDDYYLGDDNHIYCLVTTVNSNGKKIILTTDQDLIADGVQAIDDEFLEWFVKNPTCEYVEVDESKYFDGSHGEYIIIIPQEEPKQETLTYTEAAKKEERIFNSTMMSKQETLEVAAENFANSKEWIDGGASNWVQFSFKKGAKWQSERVDREIEEAAANLADPNICKTDNWIAGAKYQAERMYSEEEVKRILMKTGNYTKISLDSWFEQFKKK